MSQHQLLELKIITNEHQRINKHIKILLFLDLMHPSFVILPKKVVNHAVCPSFRYSKNSLG